MNGEGKKVWTINNIHMITFIILIKVNILVKPLSVIGIPIAYIHQHIANKTCALISGNTEDALAIYYAKRIT